ncbi:glypican-6 [Sitophilus oryzae]|uniref:Glypican-6 n=1 Tax=Sitophilus oryzae TaxID=7048 RepID=A0A6J2XGT5_SITOR|nr:glypican-6 [Sitophilus oryzae]
MAVMNRIVSGRVKMCRLQSVVLFFVMFVAETAFANPASCELVRKDMELRGIPNADVLVKPQNGSICGEGSCCSTRLEDSLEKISRQYMDKYIKDAVLKVSSLIETRAKKFDEIFRDMMNNSKLEFHSMFQRTYGKIYLDNAEVFSDFFNELETYYRKGTVRLSETMDTFFGILYQRMFTVLNAQYQFDDKYLGCVTEHMTELNPFGDVPYKLSHQLCRAFIATRTFYKALMRAAEAARTVTSLAIDDECSSSMTVMQHCGHCRGEVGAGACWRYCADTVTSCLRHYIQLSDSWDSFVDAIDKVADRLIGPYNIETVVEPLNIKISEAIMNFQENGKDVSQKIFQKCGKPALIRPTRRAVYENQPEDNPNLEIQEDPLKMGGGQSKKKHKKVTEKPDTGPNLDKLVTEIKTKIKDTKKFWLQLPYQYCSNESISAGPSDNGNCWNGTTVGTYDQSTPKSTTSENSLISEQIFVLNGITEKLRKAYQGMEVEIIDDTEESFDGSGSGSGDGGDDEDNDQEENYPDTKKNSDLNFNRGEEGYPTIPPSSSTAPPEVVRTSSANTNNSMSLARALVQYLVPLVMAWFGGAIKDLL